MPGIIYHLAFANEVFRNMSKKVNVDKIEFYAGNLIPDLVLPENKKKSHYRVSASQEGFVVPNIEKVKKDLYNKNDSIKLGIYCHLYLDYHFIQSFLIPEFIWDLEKLEVTNPTTGKSCSVGHFFAKAAKGGIIYTGYTRNNKKIIANNQIDMETINMLPYNLPLTGIPIFDKRRKRPWRYELNGYLSEDVPFKEEPFEYDRIWNAISKIAKKFVEEEI